jgi:predicted SAM-dependent methyltransferase
MRLLNFGCGPRFVSGWVNVDFSAASPAVIPHNLLTRWPFPDQSFDAVYSSHVMEHFTVDQARHVAQECYRVLKPGGVVRIVVPDLQQWATDYLRLLPAVEAGTEPRWKYDWIMIEMFDQMVRSEPGGRMHQFNHQLLAEGDRDKARYVAERTGYDPLGSAAVPARNWRDTLRKITLHRVVSRLRAVYLWSLFRLIPRSIRPMVVDQSGLGEKHRWMYDRLGMRLLLTDAGFEDFRQVDAHSSRLPELIRPGLDIHADGKPYKTCSLYCEAIRPDDPPTRRGR